MVMPWTAARRRREALDKAREAAFQAALDAVVRVVTVQAESMTAMQHTLQAYLEMFKTEGVPAPRTSASDLSESLAEADRLLALRDAGYPVDLSHLEQLQWVAARADFTPDLLT